MKLYYAPGACSLAPHILVNELNIKVDLVRTDLRQKTYGNGQDFKAVNPKGAVPVLQLDNGDILTEAAVILQYLADQKPDAGLIAKARSWERYKTLEWLNFVATEMHKGFGPLWKPDTPQAYKEIAVKNLKDRFSFLENHFEINDFLMGKNYTAPDAYLFTVCNWANYLKVDLSAWPQLVSYMVRIKERPATLKSFEEEGLK
ncbi:glutathione transferase GstA [bacterium]|nr:glutathione transferase GstA [bacterium]